MAVTSSSSSFNYSVFLSFRGPDTRHGFTGNLYSALLIRGIHTFIDDDELRRGDEISPALFKAIQESKIAIIVLSENYATSSFCLDELATIIDCKSKKGLLVIPVFYNVDPSHVRHLRGSYGEAMTKHEERFKYDMEKLGKWKEALRQVADLSGYHFKDGAGYEYQFIGDIVDQVAKEINHASIHVTEHPVGLESQVTEVRRLLDDGSDDDVQMIGIHGMGGVGKSTLARAVYNNLISEHFDGTCFLGNVREESSKHGLKHLQSILLSKILGETTIMLASEHEGISMIQLRLQQKKVLLILDDVDNIDQLKAIAGRSDWFGPGSRIIITTRDQHLLTSHEVKRRYEVKELNENDAPQLLIWNAFKKKQVDPCYGEVLRRLLFFASGLPLALEVIGSHLFRKTIEEWESAIDQYEGILPSQIQRILKVSFDVLEEEEKNVFLDIACCLKGYKMTEVEVILHALYGVSKKYHIGVLVEKSLIKVNQNGSVVLHDLIQDMGKQIDLNESPKNPGKRRRLWLPKHIFEVLEDKTGTREIEIIYLDVPTSSEEQTIEWDGNGFKKMKNLKVLIIKNGKFSEGPKCLPNSLGVLEWWGYPSNCLPSDFHPQNLAICTLPCGCLTSFEMGGSSKMFHNLTVLKFDECQSLTRIGDVSCLRNLEKLSFVNCGNLITVHESIGHLGKIKEIIASCCENLVSFPPIRLTSLEQLELTGTGLESFPEILGKMENIRHLSVSGTPIKELPISFANLVGLHDLYLFNCGSVQLPSSILMMPKLTSFAVQGGKGMKWVKQEEDEETTMGSLVSSKLSYLYVQNSNLDDDFFLIGFTQFAHIKYLDLSGNNFTFLPECIKEFQSLWYLDVSNCMHLQEIRGVPPNLKVFYATNCKSLTCVSGRMLIKEESRAAQIYEYCLAGAWIPEWLEQQSRGASTCFWFRNKFPHKILCLLIAPVCIDYRRIFPMLFINGKAQESLISRRKERKRIKMDHTYLFDLLLYYDLFKVSLENGWNHVEVTYKYKGLVDTSLIKGVGMHVLKGEGCDIRYSDPNRKRKRDDDINSIESDNQRLVKKSKLVEKEDSW